jgi:hypothetical protein
MGAFSGPETADDGIVLALDAQNPLSVGNTSVGAWEDVLSSTTTVSSVGVITCLSVDIASNQFFGQKYSSCLISGSTVWDNRPPSVSDMNEILSGNLTCKSYQTGTYDQVQYLFGAYGNAGNVCTLRFTGFGVGAVIGVGGYFNAVTRQCRLTGDLQNSPVTITSPSGGFADPIVLTSDPADIQFSNPGSSGDPWYVYWLGPYNQVPYNTLRSSYGTLTNGPVFTQEPKQEPFGGAGAVQFDGSGDYLTISNNSDHDLGSGDFTVEGWFKTSATVSYQTIIQKYYGPGAYNGYSIHLNSAGTGLQAAVFNGSNSQVDLFGGSNLNDGAWHHFALSRSGTDLRLFVDGALTDSTTNSFNITATFNLQIGRHYTVSSRDWNGQISNIRILKGTALYTSNFTPKRQPILPEFAPNTVLLTCQKGTIRDRSPSAHAITINGNAKSISGASYFEFDGTNDYVTIPDSDDFDIGPQNTMECWVKINTIGTDKLFFGKLNTWWFAMGYSAIGVSANRLGISFNDGSAWNGIQNTYNISIGTWYHLVATWDGTNIRLYVNGVLESTSSDLSSKTWNTSSSTLDIGGYSGNSSTSTNCDISNTRIYHDKALTASEVKQNYRNTKGRYGL